MTGNSAALFRLEKSIGPEEIKRVVDALVEWLQAPEQSELKSMFSAWVSQLMFRSPGSQIPVTTNREEVQSMLAERVMEWPQEWKEEGREEGLKKGRAVLVRKLERRFGPLPPEAR